MANTCKGNKLLKHRENVLNFKYILFNKIYIIEACKLPYLCSTSKLNHLTVLGWHSLVFQWYCHFCQVLTPWFLFFLFIFHFSCKIKNVTVKAYLSSGTTLLCPLIGGICYYQVMFLRSWQQWLLGFPKKWFVECSFY